MRKILTIVILWTIMASCSKEKGNTQTDKDLVYNEVKDAINNSIAWAKTKDFNLLYSIINDDSSYLEVHPENNVIKGFNEFKRNEELWSSPDFKHVGYKTSDLTITFSKSGDVAWFYCRLDDFNSWKDQPMNWENVRWTGILENINGSWRMMQGHFSHPLE
ncbi:nuclear transport factor 2 family protein [Bacteroidota bacterium]